MARERRVEKRWSGRSWSSRTRSTNFGDGESVTGSVRNGLDVRPVAAHGTAAVADGRTAHPQDDVDAAAGDERQHGVDGRSAVQHGPTAGVDVAETGAAVGLSEEQLATVAVLG